MNSPRNDVDVPASAGPRDLLDASSDAAAVLSAAGAVVGWTRGAEALLGYPPAEVTGRPATRLLTL
ncbi:PAS domain-containing protein, partial [Streptomyces sp. NPDC127079]|uniref:PAS domain-containing protein n=1 Tax=Streptomyces sp. NPDC127079 TaxID=3347132 RepID=UPI0036664B27